MKKSLLFAAAALAAISANAEVVTYDFDTTPAFFTQMKEEGLDADNYNFIANTGATFNEGELMQWKDEEGDGKWHALKNRVISLEDGCTYLMHEADAEDVAAVDFEYEVLDYASDPCYIGWDQEGIGPARMIWMKGWGTTDAWVDENYNAIDEASWVPTKNGFGFLRNGNSASRTAYIQFPKAQGPFTINLWVGHTGDDKRNTDQLISYKVTTVKDGVETDLAEYVGELGAEVAKRQYKHTVKYEGTDAVNFRIYSHSNKQLHLYHVTVDAAGAGIENVAVDAAAQDNRVFNLMGVQVDENYKGLIIKNGKKYVQK